jgi:hypothetical protein
VTQAAKVGEPTLVDPTPVSANQVAKETMRQAMGLPAGERGVSGEIVKGDGPPAANQPAPRSDAPTVANADPFARPNTANAADPNELKPTAAPDPNEAKSSAPDPNELKPMPETQNAAVSDAAAPPPMQVNEIQQAATSSGGDAAASSSSDSNLASDKDVSSSKKKKKKGLKKLIVF